MQKLATFKQFTEVTATAPIIIDQHGGRAKCLQRLIRLGMPVPRTVALSFETVQDIAADRLPDLARLLDVFGSAPLLSVRPSSQDADWGGPGAVLNIGMNAARFEQMKTEHGERVAAAIYLRFIHTYSVQVVHLDPDLFHTTGHADAARVEASLRAFEAETDKPFPQDPQIQLASVLRSMARAWQATTARLLRQAKGAPTDAGLGLILQEMVLGVGPNESGSGVIHFIDPQTGKPQITGRYLSQSQGRDALATGVGGLYLTRDARGPSLEDLCPAVFGQLLELGNISRRKLREEMEIEFIIHGGVLAILDAQRVQRNARAHVRATVALAQDGIITRHDALRRIEPLALNELLHPQIAPGVRRDPVIRGIGASPGAATGRLVFSSADAQASFARDEPCILVQRETTPEDVRGMQAANGVLTERGGATSHAAVIARGLGLPCVVGASMVTVDRRNKVLITGEKTFREGDILTLDGSTGEVLAGSVPMVDPSRDAAFETLMDWADEVRDIGVRANADTPEDAVIARDFKADGIGLCRTEHMFASPDRLAVIREMIFAETGSDRQMALDRLLPMQRADFTNLFRIMAGRPVCIRLFDPPLHEFMPRDRQGIVALAEALGRPVADVARRIDMLDEFNPMLGLRGVRLGITIPEIYDTQARAIFEAALDVSAELGTAVLPEIMIPLVSARREVEIVKARIEQVAAAVGCERSAAALFRLGVMVETPRAVLKADEIAAQCEFLSFGTNDLTQMTFGLSRDDAGRFMASYVRQGVFDEDPFHVLDRDGVGELLELGAGRARSAHKGITLSICGEHGGNSESIAFCRAAGFDHVSCSPFRVPVAKLAAARIALESADKRRLRNVLK